MAEIKRLLEIRKRRNKRKPLFVTKDAHKKARVPFKWKQPRGRHSPVRQKHKGRPKMVSVGFGTPKEIRHLHHSGLKPIIVQNQEQLEKVNPETQGIILSKKIGNKKRIELISLALKKKITILNLKDPQKHSEKLTSQFQTQQESKKKKLSEKEKKEVEKKKKAEEKEQKAEGEEKKEEKPIQEVKEEQEEKKKEQEKTLIQKQQ